jgi:hypothetical protein
MAGRFIVSTSMIRSFRNDSRSLIKNPELVTYTSRMCLLTDRRI